MTIVLDFLVLIKLIYASYIVRGSEGVKIFRGPPNHDPVSVHVW